MIVTLCHHLLSLVSCMLCGFCDGGLDLLDSFVDGVRVDMSGSRCCISSMHRCESICCHGVALVSRFFVFWLSFCCMTILSFTARWSEPRSSSSRQVLNEFKQLSAPCPASTSVCRLRKMRETSLSELMVHNFFHYKALSSWRRE